MMERGKPVSERVLETERKTERDKERKQMQYQAKHILYVKMKATNSQLVIQM